MYTIVNLETLSTIATLNSFEECIKALEVLRCYEVAEYQPNKIVVRPLKEERNNSLYLNQLEAKHTAELRANKQDEVEVLAVRIEAKQKKQIELNSTANRTLTLDGKEGKFDITWTYKKSNGEVCNDALHYTDKDKTFMGMLNEACYNGQRTKVIVITAYPKNADKTKIHNELRHAIARGQEVYLPDIDTGKPVRATAQYLDSLSTRWAMHFDDASHSYEMWHDRKGKKGTRFSGGLLKEAKLQRAYMVDPVKTLEYCKDYIRNSGYDVDFCSTTQVSKKTCTTWDAKDGIRGNAWVDDKGMTHYTSTNDMRYKEVDAERLEDILRAYIQVKAYEQYGLIPERKAEQAKRDEFFLEMYGLTEEQYNDACYSVKGYCTQTNECDINPDWVGRTDIGFEIDALDTDECTSDDYLDDYTEEPFECSEWE